MRGPAATRKGDDKVRLVRHEHGSIAKEARRAAVTRPICGTANVRDAVKLSPLSAKPVPATSTTLDHARDPAFHMDAVER